MSLRSNRPSAESTSKTLKRECFDIEQKLRERMNIPVFPDDQHGTAIISTAAILNGLRVRRTSPTCGWRFPARVPQQSPVSTCW
ncbi:hypothetical protein ACLK19_16220 [Escherichia coli]